MFDHLKNKLVMIRTDRAGVHYGTLKDIKSVSEQIDRGFALVPEDRQREGLVQTLNIGKNISLSSLKNYVKGENLYF